jgi:hypothetical protein
MTALTLNEIQQRFPIGDYIEYETQGRGFFSGIILGYVVDETGACLDLGDRKVAVWDKDGMDRAAAWHVPAEMRVPVPILEQLTLF